MHPADAGRGELGAAAAQGDHVPLGEQAQRLGREVALQLPWRPCPGHALEHAGDELLGEPSWVGQAVARGALRAEVGVGALVLLERHRQAALDVARLGSQPQP
ncbi:hypothetical protein GCM10025872_25020 [Barrientosiimonas endolithica]|uniref:Uncharacterized protein n=1 Tax=Barrientosiimonas endolithica TaxID=1535208 RepID=A0ABM8HCZ8_9MICO|nr:hypothetical protein [Barrientosiimonas endolithica]BDZ58845.1 hypothetical protein GCM10025872_25020 [Barrientosiimonas endolithica]